MNSSIILASTSPRRKALLAGMGVSFTIQVCPTDEYTDLPAREAVLFLAERKARQAAAGLSEGLVLGADTLVALNDHALGKPSDAAQAIQMLECLSGRAHTVYTGVCLLNAATGACDTRLGETRVTFRQLTEDEIRAYVATGEPMDKAGAYAIQGGAGDFVEKLDGSFENVMGLPVQLVKEMLDEVQAIEGEDG